MKSEKPRKVVHSQILEQYKIKKDLLEKLDRAMEMRAYMVSGGKTPPNEIRLFRRDWRALDDAVTKQSDGKYSLSKVTFHGLSLIPHDEAAKPFALEAA